MNKNSARSNRKLYSVARALIHQRLAHYNSLYRMPVGRIFIRNQKTRWGSCSSKGNLNFNWRIITLPPPVVDYVVVHELCHLKEFNHSKAFWNLVACAVPEYRDMRKQLKTMRLR